MFWLEFFIIGRWTVDQKILNIHLSQLSWKESPRRIDAFNFTRQIYKTNLQDQFTRPILQDAF